MRRTLAAATIAALFAGVAAPGASASHVESDCGFDSFSQQDVTGPDVYEGAAYGYATAGGDTLAVRCVIFVNGTEAASTPYGPTTPEVAATAGRVTFTAGLEDSVTLCPVVTTTAHGERVYCPIPEYPQLPPREVYEPLGAALDLVFTVVEPPLCEALRAIAPGYGAVYVNPQGDVYVDGEPQWDCPPYDVIWS